jgi:hypothetical protein
MAETKNIRDTKETMVAEMLVFGIVGIIVLVASFKLLNVIVGSPVE